MHLWVKFRTHHLSIGNKEKRWMMLQGKEQHNPIKHFISKSVTIWSMDLKQGKYIKKMMI